MRTKILLGIGLMLVAFFGFVITRKGEFRYERSGVIQASSGQIFPYISTFKQGALWNPYEKKDPNLKRSFRGSDGQVGAIEEFVGNREVGSGTLEILKTVPDQLVEIKLTMTSPFHAENLIQYQLIPEGDGTRFSWSMSGDGGFVGKLMSVFIDCEKMMAGDMEHGIENLTELVESQQPADDI